NWTALKGSGPILFAGTLAWLAGKGRLTSKKELTLLGWLASIPLFWVVVRSGNYVHDHYSLATVPPIAILGSVALARLGEKQRSRSGRAIFATLLVLSLGWPVAQMGELLLGPESSAA